MTEEFGQEQEQERPEDTMFQDAVAALRKGDKARAKDLLMLLLKADQGNPTYWIWLSAAMESQKERIYCLQTALRFDPENATAKRGLILLGALKADETVQPFLVNRPRAWEQKLLLANEKPREKGLKALVKSPVLRLAGIGGIIAALFAVVMFGFVLPRRTTVVATRTNTPGPSPTFTTTPTVFGATAVPTQRVAIGPTPLWMMLPETYTPTAVYVNTPRAGQSKDQYRMAEAAYKQGDWDAYISSMQLIIPLEPKAADIYYLIGEAYRFKGDTRSAIKSYNEALKIEPDFGAPYLGLARARMMDDPKADIEFLFDEAIKRDPKFGEIYLERARYYLLNKKAEDALDDLERADELLPNSPDVYLAYANAYLLLDDKEEALKAAEKAYALDITSVQVYKILGELYIESGDYQRAIDALTVSVTYETENAQSFALLGRAYYEVKEYEAALDNLNRAQKINRASLRKFYVYRGLANLELDNIDQAVDDLELAVGVDERNFNVQLGLARAYYMQEKFGTAFQKIEVVRSLAKSDEEKMWALYWRALIQEKRDQRKDAAKDWQALLAMDKDVVSKEMREEAQQHLIAMSTSTPTPKPGAKTPTPKAKTATPTPKVGTSTPKPGAVTVTPTRTPTPTKVK